MVEFTLPKNSKINPGKVWDKPEGASNLKEFKIYRWNPDDGKNPQVDTYYVDLDNCGPMILDGLKKAKGNKTRAAEALGISRRNLIRKVQAYGLDGSWNDKGSS